MGLIIIPVRGYHHVFGARGKIVVIPARGCPRVLGGQEADSHVEVECNHHPHLRQFPPQPHTEKCFLLVQIALNYFDSN